MMRAGTSLWSVFLESVGKDATLTGRTELWAEARNQIEQRPIFGTGAAGYWTPWNGSAQTMLELFYKEQFMAFSFHSSYFEVAVNLGFVGLAAFLAALILLFIVSSPTGSGFKTWKRPFLPLLECWLWSGLSPKWNFIRCFTSTNRCYSLAG